MCMCVFGCGRVCTEKRCVRACRESMLLQVTNYRCVCVCVRVLCLCACLSASLRAPWASGDGPPSRPRTAARVCIIEGGAPEVRQPRQASSRSVCCPTSGRPRPEPTQPPPSNPQRTPTTTASPLMRPAEAAHDAPRPQEPQRAAVRGGGGQDCRRGDGPQPGAAPFLGGEGWEG